MRTPLLLPLVATLAACANGPRSEGWAPAENTGGPTVVYDPVHKPLPEVPLPNDAAMRLDPTSPTGRRLNVSMVATTAYEREVRDKFNSLDGFGTLAPIVVAFDAPLDVLDLWHRHNDNDDFRDDALLVLNVDPDCERFGEEVAVDMGRGRFLFTLYNHGRWRADDAAPQGAVWDHFGNTLFPFDPHFDNNNWVFEETEEDGNGNGVLDPGEDIDDDGVLDVPNTLDPHACDGLRTDTFERDLCIADNLMSFYERQTNSLILRPIWPMEEQCTHAVVLTKRLRGEDGKAVMSPFPSVNHRDQTQALQRVTDLLSRYDLTLDDVAFAWSFTTGTQTKDLRAIREGLYGSGTLARLADDYPVSGMNLWTRKTLNDVFNLASDPATEDDTFLPGACGADAFTTLWNEGLGEWNANMCAIEADMSGIAGWFGGTFTAPNFLVDKDGIATAAYPDDQDELFDVNYLTGEATVGATDVTFYCALPYEDPTVTCSPGNPEGTPFCKPFPTVLYAHGYGSSRSEVSLHMGRHASMGTAACGIDSYGHGLNRWFVDPLAAGALLSSIPRFRQVGVPEMAAMIAIGRDRDLTNDGLPDGGMDQWSADIFHTRDMVRQSVVEIMQLVRMLRHMDGTTRAADGRLLGDVDGDGVVDLGGPHNTIGHWGISLGGIISGVLAGAEPGLDAISPNAAGAGLTDISVRSTQDGVPEAVVMPMLTQLVAVCLPTDGHDNVLEVDAPGGSDCMNGRGAQGATWKGGTARIALLNQDEARDVLLEVGSVEGVRPGDVLVVRNLHTGAERRAHLNARGWTRASVASDALDAIERRAVLGWGDAPGPFDIDDPEALADGLEVRIERDGTVIGTVSTFQHTVVFQGSRFNVGKPLVALQEGFGYQRNSPDVRRILTFAQHAISPGDPGVWAQHVAMYPYSAGYDPLDDGRMGRTLWMPTAGDSTVPAHTGIGLGRASGLFGSYKRDPEHYGPEVGWRAFFAPDPRYGVSVENWLLENWVVEGDPRFERWAGVDFNPQVIFDPDDVSDGEARFSCGPSDWSASNGENRCPQAYRTGEGEPENFFDIPNPEAGDALRADRPRGDGTFDAFRVPVLRPGGQHGIYNAQSFRRFDSDAYMVDFTARFLATGGADVSHNAGCDCSAADVGNFTLNGEPRFPGQGVLCEDQALAPPGTVATLKVCSPACAAAWGMRTPVQASCVTE